MMELINDIILCQFIALFLSQTYLEEGKVCTVASILEETREAHNDVLKILKQPIGEVCSSLFSNGK